MRTITKVFVPEDDREADVSEFLNQDDQYVFSLRRDLRLHDSGRELLCAECFQSLLLAGEPSGRMYFRHRKDSDDCPIKTTSHLLRDEIRAIKYNGQKEGVLHKTTKVFIAEMLRASPDFSDVAVEKTFRESNSKGVAKSWRRPDVRATEVNRDVDLVIELQVSTTFIDVIINREEFYKQQGTYIAWVFIKFEKHRFTEKDIAYANRSNALVLDDEAKTRSIEQNELWFKCYYRRPHLEGDAILYEWEFQWTDFSGLTFDAEAKKLFLVDTEALLVEVEAELEELKLVEYEKAYSEKREREEKASQRKALAALENVRYEDRFGVPESKRKFITKTVKSESDALHFLSSLSSPGHPASAWPKKERLQAVNYILDHYCSDLVRSYAIATVRAINSSFASLTDDQLRANVWAALRNVGSTEGSIDPEFLWIEVKDRAGVVGDCPLIFSPLFDGWLLSLKLCLPSVKDGVVNASSLMSCLSRYQSYFVTTCLFVYGRGWHDTVKDRAAFHRLRKRLGSHKHENQEDLLKVMDWLFP